MKQIKFCKYQGAGNDFIIIDDRDEHFPYQDYVLVEKMCDRRFGIGADGLILLRNSKIQDFSMIYFNADGHQGTMCGNGGRCIVAFARDLDVFKREKTSFEAIDGVHHAFVSDEEIRLGMKNVDRIFSFSNELEVREMNENSFYLNTGSPHYVKFLEDDVLNQMDVRILGKKVRNDEFFASQGGTNVNFAYLKGETIYLRTYERGVEDETLACGTGAVAVALAAHYSGLLRSEKISLNALGGYLTVDFKVQNVKYENVFLTGKAEKTFEGIYE
ncbi:MAG: diaminopimelate epimerase [Flavobacteriales bacterium]|nr:diaminopimelate epimerase [Flavobacteriales bacterium]